MDAQVHVLVPVLENVVGDVSRLVKLNALRLVKTNVTKAVNTSVMMRVNFNQ